MYNDRAMEIIEEYLEEVAKHLPEDLRDEVIEELRTHLIDLASEDGPMTVESAKKAVKIMGDPRKLAGEFVSIKGEKKEKSFEISLRVGEKTYRFGFSIDVDLMRSFYNFLIFLVVLIIVASIIRVMYGLLFYPSATNPFNILTDAIVSIIYLVIFIHIAMWVISEIEKHKEKNYKEKVKVIIEKKKTVVKKDYQKDVGKISGLFASGAAIIIFGIVITWFSQNISNLSMVTMILIASMGLAVIYEGIIKIIRALYFAIENRDNYFLETIERVSSLFLVPALFLINLYPESLQYIWLSATEITLNEPSDIFKYIEVYYFPSNLHPLIKIISIVLILIIFTYFIVSIIRYTRTKPKQNIFYNPTL